MNPSTDAEVKAVENPSLVDAISNHNTSNSDESADNLMSELFKATYLTAMMTNNMNIIDGIAQEGSTFGLGLIKDEEDRMLLPIFTDWVHLDKFAPGKSGLVLSAGWAYSMGSDEFDGVVINPTGYALPLYKDFLKGLAARANA
jgi:hypothetical protein